MASKYWYKAANGSDNWSVATNWYLGPGGAGGTTTVPTSADDVYLTSSSGSGTITVATTSTCNSLNATGFTGTLAGTAALNITNQTTMGPSGSTPLFAFGSGTNLTYTGTITFGGSGGTGGWIYFNGKTHLGAATFNNTTTAGAIFTLQDAFSVSAAIGTGSTLTITNGTVIANSTVSCNDFAYGTGIKSFTCGTLYLTGTGALAAGSNALNTTNSITNIIVNNGSATTKTLTLGTAFGSTNVELGGTGSGSLTLAPATTYLPNVNVTNTGTGTVLSFTTGSIKNLIFAVGTTAVWTNAVSQTLTMAGDLTFTPLQPAPTRTPALLFNQGTGLPNTSNVTMAGQVLVTGAITVNNPLTIVNFLDDFNCTLITLTATDSYAINFQGNFTCSSITNGLTSYIYVQKNLNCGALALSGTSNIYIGTIAGTSASFDSQVTVTTITFTTSGATLDMRAGTLNCGNINVGTGGTFQVYTQTLGFPATVNCTGTVILSGQGNLYIISNGNAASTFICSGTFSTTNGNVAISKSTTYFTTFTMSGVSSFLNLDLSGILYLTGTGTAFSIASTSNLTSANNSKIEFTNTSATAITFAGGTYSYYEVVFNRGASTATNTISGSNSFVNFRDLGTAAHSLSITSGTTQSMGHFDVHGSPGNRIAIIRSSTTAVSLTKSPRGLVICDYVDITNVPVTETNTWYAGPNSTVTTSANWVAGGDVRQQSSLGVG